MAKVSVWNYDGQRELLGFWNDITKETERLFKVDNRSGNSMLRISRLLLKPMAGHAVKITFKDARCLVFTFNGGVNYPFDLSAFKKRFQTLLPTTKRITTKVPTTRRITRPFSQTGIKRNTTISPTSHTKTFLEYL